MAQMTSLLPSDGRSGTAPSDVLERSEDVVLKILKLPVASLGTNTDDDVPGLRDGSGQVADDRPESAPDLVTVHGTTEGAPYLHCQS